MARKLNTYQTSLGFFDLAVAAPSMKAALEAWGADSNLFHQGAAKQTEDPDVIAATMAAPAVVLKRSVGSSGPFKEHAEPSTNLAGDNISKKAGGRAERRKKAADKAQSPLDAARRAHEKNASDIQPQVEPLVERSRAEEARWEKEK